MGKVVVINHVTLDGVMQAPARADEDTRGQFEFGGWAASHHDDVLAAKIGEWMNGEHALLLGRRSYDDLLQVWNRMGGPFRDSLNKTPKFVASRNAGTTLKWPNSTLLHGDVPASVAELKQSLEENLVIMGSQSLIGALMVAGLIDVYLLMIHPMVLGTGRRLFPDDVDAALELTDSVATTKGVLVATYRPAHAPADLV
ncbi:dihydrofolate reductase family protein [Spelaeicoccus albus]|uniref:Dihydrofolate reductase n=1 Tax=Spelaeicoccus albus TaxID=1280376 RepID=A0A7Z0D5D1_9MICO|nr:dihydrofolate reductase family protein [Spelaeicoccus albus]NYI69192.1 dihydrofolate reductase [Spelaeicoccus albus]